MLLLSGCAVHKPHFPKNPIFDPVAFFTGQVVSWGVEENRAGTPIAVVTTNCSGVPDGKGGLVMTQILHIGAAPPITRVWHLARTGPAAFTGTANDMSGMAPGRVEGPEFHWQWVLETHPANPLENVRMSQWMYLLPDGTVMVRTVVSKFGFRLAEVSENFRRLPGP